MRLARETGRCQIPFEAFSSAQLLGTTHMKKLLRLIWPFTLFLSSQAAPFSLEPPDRKNVIEPKSGLYVHRQIELRVNAARFETPPPNAANGATAELKTTRFFALGNASADFISSKYEKRDQDFVWTEVTHLSPDDLKGKTARGAELRWTLEGAETVSDGLEIFALPKPELEQIDTWSPWLDATSGRSGVFGWHAESNNEEPESPPAHAYPFQIRFRLVLSPRMYP